MKFVTSTLGGERQGIRIGDAVSLMRSPCTPPVLLPRFLTGVSRDGIPQALLRALS